MSRNAAEGIALYSELFDMGVNLEFIKEPHINTSVYREKMQVQAAKLDSTGSRATDKLLDAIMNALHDYTIDLAKEQIEIAFRTAQAEVDFLHQRTSEGVRRAQAEGKQVGRAQGVKVTTRKELHAKEVITKHSRAFGGTLSDPECMKLAGISRNSFYKYKRELLDDQSANA
jgi:DNA invertase Pin-like site-specific DNA recombinase